MGNAYSKLHNYRQELQTPNFQLIANALQFKQGRLDAGREKLQSVADRIAIAEVDKDVDKDYLRNRFETSMGIVDQYSATDLSNASFANELTGKLTEVVDDKVMNAVISSKIRSSENSEWAKAEDANDGSYSEDNRRYSSQNYAEYYNDQEVGKLYKGGGGFNPFRDVQGKIHEAMPELAKSMKAEYVNIVGGGKYFRDVVTGNRIPAWKVNEAINSLITPEDKKQLNINAWAQYDGMPDERLSSIYADNYAPKIEELNTAIKGLETTARTTKSTKVRTSANSQLVNLRKVRDSYLTNDFTTVSNKVGRNAAYNSLYMDQFKSPFLSIYTQDNITKRETYDNDVKTRTYELNLKKFQLSTRKQEFEEAKEIAKQRAAAGGGGGVGKAGNPFSDPNYIAPQEGAENVLDEAPTMDSQIEEHRKKEAGIISETKKILGITSDSQLRDVKKEIFDKGLISGNKIMFNGKEIILTDDVMATLRDYENNIINTSPAEARAWKNLDASNKMAIKVLREVAQGENPDIDFYNSMPKFNFKFVKDPDTGLMEKVTIDGTNNNNYSRLLKQESLSEDEELTLNIYHRMHMLGDPTVDAATKDILFEDMHKNLFNKLSNEDYDSFPRSTYSYGRILRSNTSTLEIFDEDLKNPSDRGGDMIVGESLSKSNFPEKYSKYFEVRDNDLFYKAEYAGYENLIGKIDNLYTTLNSGITDGERKEVQSKINGYQATLDRELPLISPRGTGSTDQDYFLSELDAKDTEYSNEQGKEVSLRSIESVMGQGVKAYYNSLETTYLDQNKKVTQHKQIFSEGSGYDKLSAQVGLNAGNKVPITVWRELDENGTPTDVVSWSYPIKGKDKKGNPIITQVKSNENTELSVETLKGTGIVDFANLENTYDASWGEDSYSVDLGNNVYSEVKNTEHARMYGNTLSMANDKLEDLMIKAYNVDPQLLEVIKSDARDFDNGEFVFKMESIGNLWHNVIYKDGVIVGKYLTSPNGVKEYNPSDITRMQNDSKSVVNKVMYNYLLEKINVARANRRVEADEIKRKQLLNN